MGTVKKQQPKQARFDKSATNQQQPQQKQQHAIASTPKDHTGSLSYADIARNGNTTAQPRLHNVQLKGTNIKQQHPLDVQSILAQQQEQFMKWQQQLQQQQQQQFLSWLQQQQQEQQQQNKLNSQRLERLEKIVFEMANMLKQRTGDTSAPQLHSNALPSQ
ncbi:ras-interacting protein RIP3-like [Drosophila simulans]|uniref:ras-interacting protein RIP3-like n=1 Tax=Drosophila simulans TaxID=7240 RepID=UPI001D11177F|nr:ras-interacting protein RIP3-like [Drosophila simulans]